MVILELLEEKDKKKTVTEFLDMETFRYCYTCPHDIDKSPDFDHELMKTIYKFINSNDILFDTWSDSPLCDILNSPSDKDEIIIALQKVQT